MQRRETEKGCSKVVTPTRLYAYHDPISLQSEVSHIKPDLLKRLDNEIMVLIRIQ